MTKEILQNREMETLAVHQNTSIEIIVGVGSKDEYVQRFRKLIKSDIRLKPGYKNTYFEPQAITGYSNKDQRISLEDTRPTKIIRTDKNISKQPKQNKFMKWASKFFQRPEELTKGSNSQYFEDGYFYDLLPPKTKLENKADLAMETIHTENADFIHKGYVQHTPQRYGSAITPSESRHKYENPRVASIFVKAIEGKKTYKPTALRYISQIVDSLVTLQKKEHRFVAIKIAKFNKAYNHRDFKGMHRLAKELFEYAIIHKSKSTDMRWEYELGLQEYLAEMWVDELASAGYEELLPDRQKLDSNIAFDIIESKIKNDPQLRLLIEQLDLNKETSVNAPLSKIIRPNDAMIRVANFVFTTYFKNNSRKLRSHELVDILTIATEWSTNPDLYNFNNLTV